jgi:hypothetical protein
MDAISMAQAKPLEQISSLNGHHRGKPTVLQMDAEMGVTSKYVHEDRYRR